MKKIQVHSQKWIVLLMTGLLCLSGCSGAAKVPETVTQSSLVIGDDGDVTAYVVDVFDKDYYKVDDLSLMAQKEVSQYNQDHMSEADPISLENIGMVEGSTDTVIVTYHFGNTQIYAEYTGNPLFYGTVAEAASAGYDLASMNQVLYAPSGESSIMAEEIVQDAKGMQNRHILLVQEAACVYCPYKVSYLSDNAKVAEDGSVDTNGVYPDKYPVVIVLDR